MTINQVNVDFDGLMFIFIPCTTITSLYSVNMDRYGNILSNQDLRMIGMEVIS